MVLKTVTASAAALILCGGYQIVMRKQLRKQGGEVPTGHTAWICLLVLYAMAVYSVTGSVTAGEAVRGVKDFSAYSEITWIPFQSGITIPTVLNLVLFLPLGFCLPAVWVRFRKPGSVIAAGFVCSLVLEAGQLFNFRATDVEDLLMNTAGAAAGFGIWVVLMKLLRKKIRWTELRSGSWMFRHEAEAVFAITFSLYFFLA